MWPLHAGIIKLLKRSSHYDFRCDVEGEKCTEKYKTNANQFVTYSQKIAITGGPPTYKMHVPLRQFTVCQILTGLSKQ